MPRDEAYLLDILIAARKALAFVEGMTWETVQRDLPRLIALIEPLVPPENEV